WFQSHIDGSRHFFSPQTVMEIQRCLGADIIMAFDECPPAKAPAPVIAAAVRRTLEWACRCKEYHSQTPPCFDYTQSLFGIVQGGTDLSLRSLCSEKLTALDFPGYAIGGCAVGESIGQMYSVVTHTAALLPVDKPRYLMGVGKPSNILECIASGVDMFDCVLPTRNGRNGSVFTWKGRINIKNACHSQAFNTPLDELCSCYTCRTFSRAYLRHLFMAKEILAIRSFTLHNIHFFQELMRHARRHIIDGTFVQWKKTTLESMKTHADDEAQIR
ncbi:MAG: tRNA guanosine(34) transglycosylase Tgt, partial [Chitinivibrionales bacterium]|nr:tRNA guanosine(34) transglycosylase Tgt [Chitinivibrionales bacterium]